MSIPGFTAESALAPAEGRYRGRSLTGGAGTGFFPAAACCRTEIRSALMVSYPHRRCGPLRDFVIAPISDSALEARPATADGRTSPPLISSVARSLQTVFDRQVCVTSNGPWNATLLEAWPCTGAPFQQLVIEAAGDLLNFVWQGGVEFHPPEVGLVNCRHVSTTRSLCPGAQSDCKCPSEFCSETEPCNCSFEHKW